MTRQEFLLHNSLRKHCVSVTILDDGVAEPTKRFYFQLNSIHSDDLSLLRFGISSATVDIVDDESKKIYSGFMITG